MATGIVDHGREGNGRQLEQAERRCMFRSGIEPHWHVYQQTDRGRGRTVRAKRRALYSCCYSWKFVSSLLRVMCEEFPIRSSGFFFLSFFLSFFFSFSSWWGIGRVGTSERRKEGGTERKGGEGSMF